MTKFRPQYVHTCSRCNKQFINTKLGLFDGPKKCDKCRHLQVESLRRRLFTGAKDIEEVLNNG